MADRFLRRWPLDILHRIARLFHVREVHCLKEVGMLACLHLPESLSPLADRALVLSLCRPFQRDSFRMDLSSGESELCSGQGNAEKPFETTTTGVGKP